MWREAVGLPLTPPAELTLLTVLSITGPETPSCASDESPRGYQNCSLYTFDW